ncbi:hypothetical protein, partial [Paenibacillus tyrfis]|uniref:hypothetical protein n=1 Tax=Paenibacillus tyrfis TaxID=1501230 RepID=UPI0020A0696D
NACYAWHFVLICSVFKELSSLFCSAVTRSNLITSRRALQLLFFRWPLVQGLLPLAATSNNVSQIPGRMQPQILAIVNRAYSSTCDVLFSGHFIALAENEKPPRSFFGTGGLVLHSVTRD